MSKRKKFLDYVKKVEGTERIISPFLPHPDVVRNTLKYLGKETTGDFIQNEIILSRELDYEPMFMTEMSSLIFNWTINRDKSDNDFEVSFIETGKGKWEKKIPKKDYTWSNEESAPVQTENDHYILMEVCERISDRKEILKEYFRNFRNRVGDNGVIVIGHPHPAWLGSQISSENIFMHWNDYPELFKKSMDSIYEASLYVMKIAVEEDIDFMSDSSSGLEMTSPKLFDEMDLPYIRGFADWTHEHNKLFWYHNCGQTRQLIFSGAFNKLNADVIETIAPFPEGDNDLAESRKALDKRITSKGNLNLTLLRDGKPEEVRAATKNIIEATKEYSHIISTADAVLPGTPPENLIAFINTAKELCER